jgi:dihydrofolate reductase
MLSIIAAIGKNRELGLEGNLLWHLPDDLKRFKALTTGHPVIMGRKTWESLPDRARPLPNRANIIVTRQATYEAPGAVVVNSFEDARAAAARAEGAAETFVIGGSQLYAEALPSTDRLYLTLVDASALADVFFPTYDQFSTPIVTEEGVGDPPHRFVTLEKQ